MYKFNYQKRESLMFKHFANKGYALFSCLGKEVLIGTLSVATLTYAKAEGVSTSEAKPDTTTTRMREVALDELSVTASRAEMTALQSAKIVSVITQDDIQRASVQTVNDVLKLATGVDVRQRGGFGVQTDISINGGTFDQITILLNGVNISNPQTGHNAADFPVSLSDISRIEVLEGAAARVFGSSAFNGAINIVTKQQFNSNNITANAEGGSYGTFGSGAGINIGGSKVANSLSASYMQSDGGMENSDFIKRRAFYQGGMLTRYLNLSWQAGLSSQDYGANTFYSAKYNNQYEATRRYIASVSGNVHNLPMGITIRPTLYWHSNYDHYQLIRGSQGAKAGENLHRTDVYGASVNAQIEWALGKTAIGADIRQEHIYSTALGELMPEADWKNIHGSSRMYDHEGKRTNTSLFAEHNVLLDRFTISAGLLANKNTALGGGMKLYPGIDISYRPNSTWKIYASWNKALRVPTYTDIYIANAVQQGDINLKPEQNSTFKAGARLRLAGVEAVVSALYSNGKNMIDWVYETSESKKYHAMNIGELDNMGFSVDTRWHLPELLGSPAFPITLVKVGYAYINQTHKTGRDIYKSLYALEYLRHKFTAELTHNIFSRLQATWSLRWQQRMNGYSPYAKLDAKLMWNAPKYTLYVKADNITAHRYYDLGGVLQPGFWIMAGGSINISL